MGEKILQRIKIVSWISILLSLWFLFLLLTELYTFLFASDRLRLLFMTKMKTMSFRNLEDFNQYTRFNIEYHFYLFVSLFGSSLAVLKFKDWGRKLLSFFSAIWIIVLLYFRFVMTRNGLDLFAVLMILLCSLTIYNLTCPEAKKHFDKKLPNVVKIFGVLLGLSGLYHIHTSIFHFLKQSLMNYHSSLFWNNLFFGVTFIACGVGVLLRKQWARLLVIFIAAVYLLYSFYGLRFKLILLAIRGLVLFVIFTYYFTRPKIRELFR